MKFKMISIDILNKSNLLTLLVRLLMVGLIVALHVRLSQFAYDDAFIHFRVARNLVDNGVPYYLSSQALKVSTSTGWIIFLAFFYWLVKAVHLVNHFPLIISISNALVTTSILIVYPRIVGVWLQKEISLLQKIILQSILLALLLPSSIGLMETPLALLAAGLATLNLSNKNLKGFAFLGTAIFLRLELIVLAIFVGSFAAIQNKRKFLEIFGWCSLGILPFVFFDLFFFQSLIPQSVIAKSLVYSITPFRTFLDILSKSLPGLSASNLAMLIINAAIVLVLAFLFIWAMIRENAIRRKTLYPLLFGLSAIIVAGVYTFEHALLFDWYIPIYMLLFVVAYFSYSYLAPPPRNLVLKIPLVMLFVASALSIISTVSAIFNHPDNFELFESGSRVKMYLTVGTILHEEYPHASLLTSEIGGLGYSFNGMVFDAAGLASPDSLLFHPMKIPEQRSNGTTGAIPIKYIDFVDPDIIVSYDIFAEELLREDLSYKYHMITLPAFLPTDSVFSETKTIWGSRYLRIYIRKSLPVSPKICALTESNDLIFNPACR